MIVTTKVSDKNEWLNNEWLNIYLNINIEIDPIV